MGVAALAACQAVLPEAWTVERFGDEIIDAILSITGYVEQARKPRMDLIGGALSELREAAAMLADAVTVEFDDSPTKHSAAGVMLRKIQSRIRRELTGIEILEGGLAGFQQKAYIGSDGETRYVNSPTHDFLRDLEPRIRLVQRALDVGANGLTAAELARAMQPSKKQSDDKPKARRTRNRPRSVGARVVNALIRDLLDKWTSIFGAYPKVTPLWQGRQDGKLSAGKQFPALVRFACERGGITVPTDNALHLEIIRAMSEHRGRA
jgi:hypothetical protein